MNTLTLNTTLYKALEEEAAKTGKQADDLAAEAIENWLSEAHADEHGRQDCASLFGRLVEEWRHERPRGVDVADMVMHPPYQRIIGMGEDAIPLILKRTRPSARPLVLGTPLDYRVQIPYLRTVRATSQRWRVLGSSGVGGMGDELSLPP